MRNRLLRRDYLLPLWMAIPFFVEGRSAAGPAAIPLAMLAAIGLVDVVLPGLQALTAKTRTNDQTESQTEPVTPLERNVFLYLLLYLLFSAYQFGFGLSNATVYAPDLEECRVQEILPLIRASSC